MALSKWTPTWILGGGSVLGFALVVVLLAGGRETRDARDAKAPSAKVAQVNEIAAPQAAEPQPLPAAPVVAAVAQVAPQAPAAADTVSTPQWGNLPPPKPILPGEEPTRALPKRTSLPSDMKVAKTERILALVKARADQVQAETTELDRQGATEELTQKRALLVRLGKQIEGMTGELADYRVAVAQGRNEDDAP